MATSTGFMSRLTNRDVFGAVVREAFLERVYERTRKECRGCLMAHLFPNTPNFKHICNGGAGVYWGLETFAEEEWTRVMKEHPQLESQYRKVLSKHPDIPRVDRRVKFSCFQTWMMDYVSPGLY